MTTNQQNNMTEEEVVQLIIKIVSIQSACYYIKGYEKSDMEQEGFIICWKAYKTKWDRVSPLENFLVVTLSNRYKNLVRDITKAQGPYMENAKNIMNPIDIDNVNWDGEKSIVYYDDVHDTMVFNDVQNKINKSIPPYLRKDYLKMIDGVKVTKSKADKIKEIINDIE